MGKGLGEKAGTEQVLQQIKDGGRDGGAASDEVISTLATSDETFRDQVYNAGKNDPALIEELGLINATDLFLSGDPSRGSGVLVPPDVDIQFRNDGTQDVTVVSEGNTRSYLGQNGEYQTFEYLPGENGQPGTVKVNNNSERSEITGVTGFEPDGSDGAPLITTANGESVIRADGSVDTTFNNGVQMTTDGSGRDGISGQVSSYKNPAANIDMQVGPDGKTEDGKTDIKVSEDGTLEYTSDDGWHTKVSPDGREVRTRGEGYEAITENRDKPGGDVTSTEYGIRGASPQPFKPEDITTSGIDQTQLGDCWFMASVAALAETPEGRQRISDMIKRNEDGSYTVTYPGDKNNPVTVSGEEVLANDKINDDALWAKVMEAALLKKNPEDANDGGKTYEALDLLTDRYVIHEPIYDYMTDTGHLADTIQNALKNGDPVVASARCGIPEDGPVEAPHAYTVTAFDSATNTVTVRNPWGHNDLGKGNTKDGVTDIGDGYMTMSIDTFAKNYQQLAYAGQPKSTFQQVGQAASELAHLPGTLFRLATPW